ncbi:hypothetical protein WJX81_001866 [Elliptochloris bilobata]|uniref:Coenzyme Q-binding protein COQ10 START domain-containing protein n=1 Tax=Elliptochloris bilobata TaxID=381761 RepID=A0AAW1RTY0_9CHLO
MQGVTVESGLSVKLVQTDHPQRSKRVLAEAAVHASVEQVWAVLTDYDHLADFVPNLDSCERLPGGRPTRYRLRQHACSQSLFWRLEAGAVLDVQEVWGDLGRREIRFSQLTGDFKEFSGRWVVEPDPGVCDGLQFATILRYELSLVPRWPLPSALVTHVVQAGLPGNIRAVARRAEELAQHRAEAPGFVAASLLDDSVVALPITLAAPAAPAAVPAADAVAAEALRACTEEKLPAKGPARRPWPTIRLQVPSLASSKSAKPYLGVTSIPLPPAVMPPVAEGPHSSSRAEERRRRQEQVEASYPAFGVEAALEAGALKALSEVHLRRLDSPDLLHRRAVTVISVDADPQEVWDVLTDYEHLPAFVPNLMLCERLPVPPEYAGRVVRLRQVGHKGMRYMQLHAEAVLDLVEREPREVQFRAVSGDFQVLQGKFIISQPMEEQLRGLPAGGKRGVTHLKYAVEVQIPRGTPMLGLLEPLLERVVFEDVPRNLAALKQRIEELRLSRRIDRLESAGEVDRAERLRRAERAERPRLADMARDWGLLAAELERMYGEQRLLPNRAQLRAAQRGDLEKAIAMHGGYADVAMRLGWRMMSRSRKPPGYWDALPNVHREVTAFCEEQGLPPFVMPYKKDFLQANRHDLARVVERYGGLYELAEKLGFQVLPANRGASEWNLHVVRTAEATGLSGKDGLFKVAAATYRPRRAASSLDGGELGGVGPLDSEDRLLGAATEMAAALAGAAGPALGWRGSEDAWDGAAAAGNGSFASKGLQPAGARGRRGAPPSLEAGGDSAGWDGGCAGRDPTRKDIPAAGNIRQEIDGW